MATGGVLGNGSKVGYSASSPLSYTKIGQLKDLTQFISLISGDVDTTVHSTSRVMTSMPGMIPAPEIKFDLVANLDQASDATHEALRTYQSAGTTIYFRIEIPVDRLQANFRAWEFQAYVKEWTPEVKIAGEQLIHVTLKYGGGLTVYNAGAGILP